MSRKRRFPDVDDDILGDPTDTTELTPPLFKKPKLEDAWDDETDDESICVFNVVDVRDVVLDYLPFDENFSIFMRYADDAYFARSFLSLNKDDVVQIKSRIDALEPEDEKRIKRKRERERGSGSLVDVVLNEMTHPIYKYDVHKLCVFYGTVKFLFGEHFFRNALRIPFHIVKTEEMCFDIDAQLTKCAIVWDVNDARQYIKTAHFEFKSARNLTSLFDAEQLQVINQINPHLDVTDINAFILKENLLDPYRLTWSVFNATRDADTKQYENVWFVCAPKPQISGMCVYTHSSPPIIHTKDLLPSLQIALIVHLGSANDDGNDDDDNRTVCVTVDHGRYHNLKILGLAAVGDAQLSVSINFATIPTNRFLIIPSGDATYDLFDQYPPVITASELKFIRAFKGDDEYTPHFSVIDEDTDHEGLGLGNKSLFDMSDGILPLRFGKDLFYFRFVPKSCNSGYRLISVGCHLCGFSQNRQNRPSQPVQISTSQIVPHWEIVKLENAYAPNGDAGDVKIVMDRFPPNLKQLVVIDKGLSLRQLSSEMNFCPQKMDVVVAEPLKYLDIPDCLELLQLPMVIETFARFPGIIKHQQLISQLPYKKVKFRFDLAMQQMSERFAAELETFLHQDFCAIYNDNYITISQKRRY